jgi:hypothetical protein
MTESEATALREALRAILREGVPDYTPRRIGSAIAQACWAKQSTMPPSANFPLANKHRRQRGQQHCCKHKSREKFAVQHGLSLVGREHTLLSATDAECFSR